MAVVVKRAFVLLSCTFMGLICGTLYLISSYSPQFAKRLGYSVSESSTMALLGSLGIAVAGPIAGVVVDRAGYTIPLIIGGVQIIVGYLSLKAQYDYQYPNVLLSAFIVFAIGSGSTFINSTTLKCCAVTFPSIRGMATSLPLALYGLSAMFYSLVALMFFPGDTLRFLGFLGYLALVIFIICAPSVMWCDYEVKKVIEPTLPLPESVEMSNLRPFITRSNAVTPQLSPRVSFTRTQKHVTELGGIELLKSSNFWLLFIVTGLLAALGQMYIYSVGYMVKALVTIEISKSSPELLNNIEAAIQRDQQLQVGLLLVANCAGRILAGILGDIALQSYKIKRSWLLFIPALGLFVTQLMGMNILQYPELSLDSLLTGLFYGFTFCILPSIVGDTFGMENFSLNWGIIGLAPILPSFYFTSLFGRIYDSNSQPNQFAEGNTMVCLLGKHCYSSIFELTFVLAIVAIVCVGAQHYRWKRVESYEPLFPLQKGLRL